MRTNDNSQATNLDLNFIHILGKVGNDDFVGGGRLDCGFGAVG
jgi:hypothetical protein